VAGQRLNDLSEDELARWRARHVGLIFQFFNLIPVLSARDNVALPLLLTKLDKAERIRRADTALRVVGLEERLDPYPRPPSGTAVKYARLVLANLGRNKLRTALTGGAIMLAVLLVCVLLTMPAGLDAFLNNIASNTRISVHNKAGLVYAMPYAFTRKVRQIDGVAAACAFVWFGGAFEEAGRVTFPNFAVEVEHVGAVYPDYDVPAQQLADFQRYRDGAPASETETSFFSSFFGSLKVFVTIILVVTGLVALCIVFIAANTASMGVRERAGELAVLKAIGFGRRVIFGTLLAEATVLSMVAGLGGVLLTIALTDALHTFAGWNP